MKRKKRKEKKSDEKLKTTKKTKTNSLKPSYPHLDHSEDKKNVRRERLDGDGLDGGVWGKGVDSVFSEGFCCSCVFAYKKRGKGEGEKNSISLSSLFEKREESPTFSSQISSFSPRISRQKMNVFSRCPPRAHEGSGQWKVGITSGIFSSVLFSVFSFVAAALLPLALITLARASSVPLFRHRHSLSPSPSYL